MKPVHPLFQQLTFFDSDFQGLDDFPVAKVLSILIHAWVGEVPPQLLSRNLVQVFALATFSSQQWQEDALWGYDSPFEALPKETVCSAKPAGRIMFKRTKLFPVFCLIALALASAAAPLVVAQEKPSNPLPNSVWVGADGKFEAEPDTVLLQFNISAQDEKLQAANDRATRAAEQVRQLLRSNGLDPKDAQFGRFSVEPVYDYQNPKRKLLGYRVNSDISIKFKDFTKVGPLTQGLADMDVTADQSLSYILEDEDAAKLKAVADAMRKAHDEADAVAHASGRVLGDMSYASVDTYERGPQPRPMMMSAAPMAKTANAAPAPTEDFGTQKITVTAHVNALYNLK